MEDRQNFPGEIPAAGELDQRPYRPRPTCQIADDATEARPVDPCPREAVWEQYLLPDCGHGHRLLCLAHADLLSEWFNAGWARGATASCAHCGTVKFDIKRTPIRS